MILPSASPVSWLVALAAALAYALPAAAAFVEWATFAFGSGIAGLLIGVLMIPVAGYVIGPLLKRLKR